MLLHFAMWFLKTIEVWAIAQKTAEQKVLRSINGNIECINLLAANCPVW